MVCAIERRESRVRGIERHQTHVKRLIQLDPSGEVIRFSGPYEFTKNAIEINTRRIGESAQTITIHFLRAGAFGGAEANMKQTGEYRGVVLDNIDPVKLAEGFGVEGMDATEESNIADAIEHGLKIVEEEKRPFLLNVHLPIGLPGGGRPKAPYSLKDDR